MIILKAIMLISTIFLLIANNYRKEDNDFQGLINIVLISYIAIILFG